MGGSGSQLNFRCRVIKGKREGEGYYQLWDFIELIYKTDQ